jgi:hypothetical protein
MDKTKIIVFRNGGKLKHNEKWYYKGKSLEVVSFYKYLGIIFTSKLQWSLAQKTLASQGLKAMFNISRVSRLADGFSPKMQLDMFSKMIMPILTYGAEIWGYKTERCVENVQIKFCKQILGVSSSASRAVALGECGRLPLAVNCIMKFIKFWVKLIKLDSSILTRAAYVMLYDLDKMGRHTWATEVKKTLNLYGFGYVWMNQKVENEMVFLNEFKNKVISLSVQKWQEELKSNRKLYYYCIFKEYLAPETYLIHVQNKYQRVMFAKFRCSDHQLHIEKGRHTGVIRQERYCDYCKKHNSFCVEDEFHFLLLCPLYKDLRASILAKYYSCNPTEN